MYLELVASFKIIQIINFKLLILITIFTVQFTRNIMWCTAEHRYSA